MDILGPISFDEVILEFLRQETKTKPHEYESFDASLLESPRFDDEFECSLRKKLLYKRRSGLLLFVPPDTSWYRARIEERDYELLRLIHEHHWLKMSEGTGLVSYASHKS